LKENEIPSFTNFALYLVYFPKLISGPIEKPFSFLQKIKNPLLVTNELIYKAFGLIFNGLIRKIVIANLLQILVPPLFTFGTNPSWMSLFAFSMVLYNDFLGYTSVVRGISLFFGIDLSRNFQQPYFARNFSEFWSHWHISLSVWLRETIFFPISRKLIRINTKTGTLLAFILPPVITMALSGLWHGAIFSMLIWGFFHGILLIIERLIYEKWPASRPGRLNLPGQMASWIVTYFFVSFGWVLFASPGLRRAIDAIEELIFRPVFAEKISIILPLGLIFLSFLLDYAAQKQGDELWWQKLGLSSRAVGIAIFLLILTAAITYQNQEPVKSFIYQGF
jgi:D-alanyl-lipoteichoic acid acyltransferase DltB (MBOAT superfamily)